MMGNHRVVNPVHSRKLEELLCRLGLAIESGRVQIAFVLGAIFFHRLNNASQQRRDLLPFRLLKKWHRFTALIAIVGFHFQEFMWRGELGTF
jgi:hypothetical protein